ncbi:TraB/GumN family protein [Piscinibacter aquaticus]|uniref:TraB/GumN family protein n=1 Tax=Piscinibacter aquaticus TaxID=392597 RepID=A0A5C6U6K1_9BURK|nr:TraB/GumN family protein [Piscinibacter aquaticus]
MPWPPRHWPWPCPRWRRTIARRRSRRPRRRPWPRRSAVRATAASCGSWRRTAAAPGSTAPCTSGGWSGPSRPARGAGAGAEPVLALELDLLDPDTQRRPAAGSGRGPARPCPSRCSSASSAAPAPNVRRPSSWLRCAPSCSWPRSACSRGGAWGWSRGYGIDASLSALARRDGKTVAALETVDEQLRTISAASPKDLLELARSTLDELDSGRAQKMLEQIARIWALGDHARLARYAEWCDCQRTPAEAAAMRRLLDERHPAMAARLDALHRSGRTVFAAVGSLHLTGSRSLPALMAQRGYRVERMALEAPMPDIHALWDFDDPAASEARFRAAMADATHDAALSLRTQIARTHSLRRQFDAAHRELDAVDAELAGAGTEPRVRTLLERGRTGARPASRRGPGRCSCRRSSWRARPGSKTCMSMRCTWSPWCSTTPRSRWPGRAGRWRLR